MAAPSTGRTITAATLIAGTLDILSACVYAGIAGRTPVQMLQGVASAVWPDARGAGAGGALAGLALHFAIMGVMAAVYVLAARRLTALRARPLLWGVLYGLATWAVMNQLVLPLRWSELFPKFDGVSLFEQLFSHILLVGIPIALVTARAYPAPIATHSQ